MSTSRLAPFLTWLALGLVAAACGDDGGPPPEGDGGAADAASDAGGQPPVELSLPGPPVLTPCPAGWREVAGASGRDPSTCEPWPEGGPSTCGEDEAHFPGDPTCVRIGDACPADGVPTSLPADAVVIHVRFGATAGDGSATAPFGAIADAVDASPATAVVAIAPGRYDEAVSIAQPLILWGACMDTVITQSAPSPGISVTSASSADIVEVRNLKVEQVQSGIFAARVVLELRDVIIQDTIAAGLTVFAASLRARSLVLRRVGDAALDVSASGRAALGRVAIDGVGAEGIRLATSELQLSDTVIRGLSADPTHLMLIAIGGAYAGLERVAVRGDGSARTLVSGPSTLRVFDSLVEAPPATATTLDDGILALEGATVNLERVRFERPRYYVLGALDPGTRVTVRDVVARDIVPLASTGRGFFLEAALGAEVELSRALLQRAQGVGFMLIDGGTIASLEDVEIADTLALRTGVQGRALQVQGGARVEGQRVRITRSHEVALAAVNTGTRVVLGDLQVDETAPRDCAGETCAGAGVGVGSYLGAHVELTGFRVSNNALAGVQVARDGAMDLHRGEITDNPVGANVQADGYDVGRLDDGVSYLRNGVNLDATALPVPDPVPPGTGA